MREIEDRLRELGDRVESWNPSRSLPDSTRSRIKRRRRTSALAGGVVASTMVLGIVSLLPPDVVTPPPAGDRSVATGSEGTPGTGPQEPDASSPRLPRDDFFGAVWPEDDRAETEHGCAEAASDPDTFRASAMGTAVEFGRAVLGWQEAEGIARGEYRNSMQIELAREASSSSAVDLSLVEYVPGCWSVQSVSPTDTTVPAITMPTMWQREVTDDGEKNVLSVGFDPPEGARGRVELAYGAQVERRRFTAQDVSMDRPLVFSFGAIGAYEGGHALILFEDPDGRVTTAIGASLLPQKGGARSDGLP